MRDKILKAALVVAAVPGGFKRLTREKVAKQANVAAGLVTYYFGNMDGLRSAIVRKSIEDENLPVLGAAIADRHQGAMRVEEALKTRALRAHFAT